MTILTSNAFRESADNYQSSDLTVPDDVAEIHSRAPIVTGMPADVDSIYMKYCKAYESLKDFYTVKHKEYTAHINKMHLSGGGMMPYSIFLEKLIQLDRNIRSGKLYIDLQLYIDDNMRVCTASISNKGRAIAVGASTKKVIAGTWLTMRSLDDIEISVALRRAIQMLIDGPLDVIRWSTRDNVAYSSQSGIDANQSVTKDL